MEDEVKIRLDKWLWAARFFKTRRLATTAINGGKVQVAGQRAKPSRSVQIGTEIHIRKGDIEWDILVQGLSKQRRPAVEATQLYEETDQSQQRRRQYQQERRANPQTTPLSQRPNKKDRRLIHRFTQKS